MNEPSKEALKMAAEPIIDHINSTFGPFDGSANLRRKFAAALQKLMDERDEARRVARVLAVGSRASKDWDAYDAAYETALAYPEVKP